MASIAVVLESSKREVCVPGTPYSSLYTVKRFIFASENIRERPVFCREELFAFFIFAAVFILGVSNVGGATFMNEQACVESCVRGYHAYKRYGKHLLSRSWIAGESSTTDCRAFFWRTFLVRTPLGK